MHSLLTTSNSEWDFCHVSGRPVHELHTQIQAQLSSNPDLAYLFSEPVIDRLRGKIEWVSQVDGSIDGCFADLSADKQQQLKNKLTLLYNKLNQLISLLKESENRGAAVMAEALELALNIPTENFIYSIDGEPVLVGWGHRAPGDIANPFILKQLCHPSPTNEDEGIAHDEADSAMGNDSSTDSQLQKSTAGASSFWQPFTTRKHHHRNYDDELPHRNTNYYYETITYVHRPIASISWWLAVGLLFLAILWLMLRNCALGFPGIGWLANYCPPTTVVSASNNIASLEEELRRLQEQIAQAQIDCLDTNENLPNLEPDSQSNESNLSSNLPAEENESAEESESAESNISTKAIDRVLEQGGTIKAVNIILSWHNGDDLDLHLVCPEGDRISYDKTESCGGALDVDMNINDSRLSTSPVENIVFAEGSATAGEYHIEVMLYKDREPVATATDFQVQLLIGGEVIQTVNDSIRGERAAKRLISFNLPHNSLGN